jgi:hypothetical protein
MPSIFHSARLPPEQPTIDINYDIIQANKHESISIPHSKEQFGAARQAAIESNSQRSNINTGNEQRQDRYRR